MLSEFLYYKGYKGYKVIKVIKVITGVQKQQQSRHGVLLSYFWVDFVKIAAGSIIGMSTRFLRFSLKIFFSF
jgi:hypothetical protein